MVKVAVKKPSGPSDKTMINDLIFKELIKRGYSLEGNTRVWNIADSKLWYLTPEQAQAYLDILDSESYGSDFGPKELILIHKYLKEFIKKIGKGPLNLVDLGCGDGRKAAIFVKGFSEEGEEIRYCPIDISGYMVTKAINTISNLGISEVIESKWNISDFENLENITPLLNYKEYKKSFFLLLGNTLGNFEFHELMYEVRSSMKSGDLLLIGNGLDNNKVEEDVVRFCKENKLFNKFFTKIPLQIGLDKGDIEFEVRFRNSRIEYYYILNKDKKVKFQNKEINFLKGDQLIVAVSYHYNKDDFISFLNLYFDEVNVKVSDDGSYALALCKK